MNKTIPEVIKKIMDEEKYNSCESFEYDGVTYYSVGCVADDGTPLPTGLPEIYTIEDGRAIGLLGDAALDLLSKLPYDEEEDE